MRVDLHLHTMYSGDCATHPKIVVERCKAAGLGCIAVTDHNSIRGALHVRELADFPVIVGEEVMSNSGEIIGLFLEEEIPRGLSPEETVKRIKAQGGLVHIPHPFDRIRRGPLSAAALKQVLPQADLLEVLNSRTLLPGDLMRCTALSQRSNAIPIAVSDSHTPGEFGASYMDIDPFDLSPSSLLEALKQGQVVGRRSSPLVHLTTAYVKLSKKFASSKAQR
ncbi:MAG: PHP domain-containing protein [Dehalococcoidia bacterium]|nr:PHP domain-containing protein [Dehalococcoidia bacterium]